MTDMIAFSTVAALRCSATLKARVLKDAWNGAAVIPVEKGAMGAGHQRQGDRCVNGQRQQQLLQLEHRDRELESSSSMSSFSDDLVPAEENTFLGNCTLELLARGTQLLKRTRKGTTD